MDRVSRGTSGSGRPTRPAPPLEHAALDRFRLAAPVTLDDLAELQRRLRALAPDAAVEVRATDGRFAEIVAVLDWPNGARLERSFPVRA